MKQENNDQPSARTDDEELLFGAEEEEKAEDLFPLTASFKPVLLLVVDDEPGVHGITDAALGKVTYYGRPLQLLHAHSAEEAREVLLSIPDVAVILLDVVMETDDAGLRLVEWIREEWGNQVVRIILRTGQPGQAPERQVIVDYHINDYKDKTELTADKLYTAVVTAIRSHEEVRAVEESQRGLEMILESSSTMMRLRSMQQFGTGMLIQIAALMDVPCEGILCVQSGHMGGHSVLVGSGRYQDLTSLSTGSVPARAVADIRRALQERHHVYTEGYTVLFLSAVVSKPQAFAVYLETGCTPPPMLQMLLQVFCDKLAVGLENSHLFETQSHLLEQLKRAQQATVVILADFAEYKDIDTGNHVLRVAEMTEAIARRLNQSGPYASLFSEATLELIGMASILHDVGKMAIPDSILQKPGPLTPMERTIMQTHVTRGETILNKASEMTEGETYLSLGAEIAGSHHEWFNGKGYPRGLIGQEIPLSGRIVALVDVYDALLHERPYKLAWPLERVLATIRRASAEQFDPAVVDAFLELYFPKSAEKAPHGIIAES
jgi:response regulator RpfG family c-di-GMP phosphodiesterase